MKGDTITDPYLFVKTTVVDHYRGGTLFKTAEEVDAYIRAERDAWGC